MRASWTREVTPSFQKTCRSGQPPGGVGQGGRPFGVAFGQCAADQQDRAIRIGDLAAEHGQLQVLLQVLDVSV